MTTQTVTARVLRMENINKIVAEITSRGHEFFKGENGKKDGHFLIKNEKLYWWDAYNNKPLRPIERNRFLFNSGRSLWEQMLSFAEFIEEGEKGRIWSDYWGYPEEDVKAIHDLARELGFLASLVTTEN